MRTNILILANLVEQTFGLNANQHRNAVIVIQYLLQTRYKERNLPHRTQANAAEFDRRARLKATDGIFKEHQEVDVIGIECVLNAALIVKEPERRFLCNRLSQILPFRHIKAYTATKQRGQGAHLHAHSR